MKKTLLVMALAACMLLALAAPAFAQHGGYTTTGTTCGTCHAVHNSVGGHLFIGPNSAYKAPNKTQTYTGEILAMTATSKTTDLCEYCHYGSAFQLGDTKTKVNASLQAAAPGTSTVVSSMHEIGVKAIPDQAAPAAGSLSETVINDVTTNGLGCVDCHDALPHGAKDNTSFKYDGVTLHSQDADLTDFCSKCHNKNTATDGTSHPVGPDALASHQVQTTLYGLQQVSSTDAADCASCHAVADFHFGLNKAVQVTSPVGVPNAGKLVNFALEYGQTSTLSTNEGNAFTGFAWGASHGAATTGGVVDGQCLQCHQWDSGTAGVGKTF